MKRKVRCHFGESCLDVGENLTVTPFTKSLACVFYFFVLIFIFLVLLESTWNLYFFLQEYESAIPLDYLKGLDSCYKTFLDEMR